MFRMKLLLTFASNLIELVFALLSVVLTRWLLGLSSYTKDICWLQSQDWYMYFDHLKFYRGLEYLHQLQGQRILEHSFTTR